jgi:hypothetical protein
MKAELPLVSPLAVALPFVVIRWNRNGEVVD